VLNEEDTWKLLASKLEERESSGISLLWGSFYFFIESPHSSIEAIKTKPSTYLEEEETKNIWQTPLITILAIKKLPKPEWRGTSLYYILNPRLFQYPFAKMWEKILTSVRPIVDLYMLQKNKKKNGWLSVWGLWNWELPPVWDHLRSLHHFTLFSLWHTDARTGAN
jgi:hypothetical protein